MTKGFGVAGLAMLAALAALSAGGSRRRHLDRQGEAR